MASLGLNELKKKPHKSHPIAQPWGWAMGCLLWLQSLIYTRLLLLVHSMLIQYMVSVLKIRAICLWKRTLSCKQLCLLCLPMKAIYCTLQIYVEILGQYICQMVNHITSIVKINLSSQVCLKGNRDMFLYQKQINEIPVNHNLTSKTLTSHSYVTKWCLTIMV